MCSKYQTLPLIELIQTQKLVPKTLNPHNSHRIINHNTTKSYQNHDTYSQPFKKIQGWDSISNQLHQYSNMLFNLHANLKNYEDLQKKTDNQIKKKRQRYIVSKRASSVLQVQKKQQNLEDEFNDHFKSVKLFNDEQKFQFFKKFESRQTVINTVQEPTNKKYRQLSIKNHGLYEKNNMFKIKSQKNLKNQKGLKNEYMRKPSRKILQEDKLKINLEKEKQKNIDLYIGYKNKQEIKKDLEPLMKKVKHKKRNEQNLLPPPASQKKRCLPNTLKDKGDFENKNHKKQFQNQFEDTKLFVLR